MRPLFILLCCVTLLCTAGATYAARASGTTMHGEHLSATITTTPRLLEPGPVTITATVIDNGEVLRNAPVRLTLASSHKTFFDATVTTDVQGNAQVHLYLDEAGKPVLTIAAAGESISTPILVKGRGILVAGFVTALAVLVVLLLDRP